MSQRHQPVPESDLVLPNAITMDAHTLELLEFAKVRELVAAHAFSSLGKDLARQAAPSTDADAIRAELALVTEMVQILGEGQSPPFAGLSDVRLLARRAAIGASSKTSCVRSRRARGPPATATRAVAAWSWWRRSTARPARSLRSP